jgi:nitroreductase
MSFDRLIRTRRSVRKFKSKAPDWRNIIEAIDAARFVSMAGGGYSLRFIVVTDPEKIQELAYASQQDFVAQTHYVVVVCSYNPLTINQYGERGYKYLRQQAGAGIQNFWLKLVEKKLSTCWIGSFVDDMVKKTLSIPETVEVEALFPIGYDLQKPTRKKSKIEIDSILYFDKYGNKQMKNIKKIEA